MLENLKGVSLKALLNNTAMHATWSKDFAQAVIILTASDGYSNSYSWNELFNSDIGDHVYIITGEGNIPLIELSNRVAVISMKDYQTGIRYLKGLSTINIKLVNQVNPHTEIGH